MADAKGDLVVRVGDPKWEDEAVTVIRGWLTTAVDTLALVFGTLADKPQYQSRVTIIVYRVSDAGGKTHATGMHWISYSGQLKPHLKDHLFDETSVGYKVLKQPLGLLTSRPMKSLRKRGRRAPTTPPTGLSLRSG